MQIENNIKDKYANWDFEEKKVVIDPKTIIDVTEYKINCNGGNGGVLDEITLITYTATWCNPCKRIKPIVTELMTVNNFNESMHKTITKTDFKKSVNDFVPFFVLEKNVMIDKIGCDVLHYERVKIDSIQTSDKTEFINFLKKHKISVKEEE